VRERVTYDERFGVVDFDEVSDARCVELNWMFYI